MTNVDIKGCRRRSSYDFQKERGQKVDFGCVGKYVGKVMGPPCTVKLGDLANFTATFQAGIKNISTLIMYLEHYLIYLFYILE